MSDLTYDDEENPKSHALGYEVKKTSEGLINSPPLNKRVSDFFWRGVLLSNRMYRNALLELKKSKIQDFLRKRCSGRKTFLGPN